MFLEDSDSSFEILDKKRDGEYETNLYSTSCSRNQNRVDSIIPSDLAKIASQRIKSSNPTQRKKILEIEKCRLLNQTRFSTLIKKETIGSQTYIKNSIVTNHSMNNTLNPMNNT